MRSARVMGRMLSFGGETGKPYFGGAVPVRRVLSTINVRRAAGASAGRDGELLDEVVAHTVVVPRLIERLDVARRIGCPA